MKLAGVERQQHFIQLASVHAEDFKTRVPQHDRENSLRDKKQLLLLKACARESLIICSGTSDPRMNTVIGFAGLNYTTRSAEKVQGGYRVSGLAGFSSPCVCADFFEETAHYEDPAKGPSCLYFVVPAKTSGIKIQNN